MSDRLREKHDLLVKLGVLFGPLLHLIEHEDQYDLQDVSEAIARYCAEFPALQNDFRMFSNGQPGHSYAVEHKKFFIALQEVQTHLSNDSGRSLEDIVRAALHTARSAIDAVPIPRTSVILEAGTPFTAYRKLRELCEADVTKSLAWLDPFLDATIFTRYLIGVRRGTSVTLLSSEPRANAGQREKQRWAGLLEASRLYAQEYGANAYRFLQLADLHDRWVVLDDKRIYSLGGSVKDAAARDYFTITSVEASPMNLDRLQRHLAAATELFGPSVPVHL
jgi:hypothetical protein